MGNKKDEFVREFEQATKQKAESFKGKPKEFADALNGATGELRALFREAVEEAKTGTEESAAAGLAALFPAQG